MITFYVFISARLSEKWQSKICFRERKSVYLTLKLAKITGTSYYQLTFSESNRLIVLVICAWLSIKAIVIATK